MLATIAVGLGAGLSPFFSAYYNEAVWVPLGLVVTLGAATVVLARAPRITLPAAITLGGLAGLGLFSLLSSDWGFSGESATVEGIRWLSYAPLVLLLIVLLRSPQRAQMLLVTVGV